MINARFQGMAAKAFLNEPGRRGGSASWVEKDCWRKKKLLADAPPPTPPIGAGLAKTKFLS